MIAVDTNVLVHAHRADSDWHDAATGCVRKLAEGRAAWAIPWPCVHEFYAIVTHPKIWDPPTPREVAIAQLEGWFASPTLVLLSEAASHWSELRSLVEAGRVVGPRIHDARVAALCLTHGVRELWTADRDFNRFPSLNTHNPLAT